MGGLLFQETFWPAWPMPLIHNGDVIRLSNAEVLESTLMCDLLRENQTRRLLTLSGFSGLLHIKTGNTTRSNLFVMHYHLTCALKVI